MSEELLTSEGSGEREGEGFLEGLQDFELQAELT